MHTTLFMVGKRVATGVTGRSVSCLFFITDRITGTRFLVDTGAEVSVILPSAAERRLIKPKERPTLQAVNNTSIGTFSERSLTLDFGLRRRFRWIFILADVKSPILGADFLRAHNLSVDVGHNRLTDGATQFSVQGIASQASAVGPTLIPPGLDPV